MASKTISRKIEAPPIEHKNGSLSRKLHIKKRSTERVFLAVAIAADNLSVLLECFYTAQLLRKKNPHFRAEILVHTQNRLLAEQSGVFQRVYSFQDEDNLRELILKLRKDILYVPDQGLKTWLATLFSGARLKVAGGAGGRLTSKLLNLYFGNHSGDLNRLRKKGVDLFPEAASFLLKPMLDASHLDLPERPFVWLSLFDDHEVTAPWPPGYVARLARLLEQQSFDVVVPVPPGKGKALVDTLDYLKRSTPSLVFLNNCYPQDRAAGMLRADCVVGPAGPEIALACLLLKPVIALHDMLSYTSRNKAQAEKQKNLSIPAHLHFTNGNSEDLKPNVDKCIAHCNSCEYNSCLEFISPERVFENMKKILFPF